MGRARTDRPEAAGVPVLGLAALILLAGCDADPFHPEAVEAHFAGDGSMLVLGAANRFYVPDPATMVAPAGDLWLARLEDGGATTRWQTVVGTAALQGAAGFTETATGRIVVAGYDLTTDADAWLLAFDPDGDLTWERVLRGDGLQELRDVVELPAGDLVAVGNHITMDGASLLVMRADRDGISCWQQVLGLEGRVGGAQVLLRDDGDVMVVGLAEGAAGGPAEAIVVSVRVGADCADPDGGAVAWARLVGADDGFAPGRAALLPGGGLLLAGASAPPAGDPALGEVCYDRLDNDGNGAVDEGCLPRDARVVSLGPGGDLLWDLALEGDGDEGIADLLPLSDGRFLLAGTTDGYGSRIAGDTDLWLVWITADGTLDLQRSYGSTDPERPLALRQGADETVTVAVAQGGAFPILRVDGEGALVEGCGIARDTTAHVVGGSVAVREPVLSRDPTGLILDSVMPDSDRPAPLAVPICNP